jgi:hypothetical protein
MFFCALLFFFSFFDGVCSGAPENEPKNHLICSTYMKTILGAVEMYNLDQNKSQTIKSRSDLQMLVDLGFMKGVPETPGYPGEDLYRTDEVGNVWNLKYGVLGGECNKSESGLCEKFLEEYTKNNSKLKNAKVQGYQFLTWGQSLEEARNSLNSNNLCIRDVNSGDPGMLPLGQTEQYMMYICQAGAVIGGGAKEAIFYFMNKSGLGGVTVSLGDYSNEAHNIYATSLREKYGQTKQLTESEIRLLNSRVTDSIYSSFAENSIRLQIVRTQGKLSLLITYANDEFAEIMWKENNKKTDISSDL